MGMSLLAPQRMASGEGTEVLLYDDSGATDGYMIPGNAVSY
jgi:hypothetical protein